MQSDFGSSGKNLTIFNDGGEGNEAGSTQVEFPNPEDVWIPGSRWRELRLNKDSMEEITEAVFFAPSTREYFRVPLQKKYNFLGFLITLSLGGNWLCGKRRRKRIYEFIWTEEASQGTLPRIELRAGQNWNGWRNPLTAWIYAMMKINASNDFHETLISK